MAELSIIEFIVYGLIGYTGLLFVILTSIKEIPLSKSFSLGRAVFLVPSVIMLYILGGAVTDITIETTTTTTIGYNATVTNEVILNQTQTETNNIDLINPIWVTIHIMFAVLVSLYILINILNMLTKKD